MIEKIRTRLGVGDEDDRGLTLIEVIVALMVFGIVAMGVAYSLASILALTRDSRSIAAATNLAAQVVDTSRSSEDVFKVLDDDYTVTVDKIDYYVSVRTGWVTSSNSSAQCGASGTSTGNGSLDFKRVNVSVKWKGMRSNAKPVRSDTLISPNSRINDPNLGTILVTVLTATGTGSAGIKVSATKNSAAGNTAVTPAVPPLDTDNQGCSYVLKVTPGKYDVKIEKPGYVDVDQIVGSVTRLVEVKAGQASSVGFQFDAPGLINPQYAPGIAGVILPTALPTTYVSTYGLVLKDKGQVGLHPFPSGYQVFAGSFVGPTTAKPEGCKSPDPAAWSTPRADGALGVREPGVIPVGGAATATPAPVPMGLVSVSNMNNQFITAVSATPTAGSGDPGCSIPYTLNFPKLTNGSATTLALPFGTWKLTSGNSQTASTSTALSATILSPSGVPLGTPASSTVTLDPRKVLG